MAWQKFVHRLEMMIGRNRMTRFGHRLWRKLGMPTDIVLEQSDHNSSLSEEHIDMSSFSVCGLVHDHSFVANPNDQ